jgi:hypothetical protein
MGHGSILEGPPSRGQAEQVSPGDFPPQNKRLPCRSALKWPAQSPSRWRLIQVNFEEYPLVECRFAKRAGIAKILSRYLPFLAFERR